MITEVATAQAQTLDDWARNWSTETADGSSEVTFLLQRAARMIRRAVGVATPVDVARAAEDAQGGTEPMIGRRHDPAVTRAELRDG